MLQLIEWFFCSLALLLSLWFLRRYLRASATTAKPTEFLPAPGEEVLPRSSLSREETGATVFRLKPAVKSGRRAPDTGGWFFAVLSLAGPLCSIASVVVTLIVLPPLLRVTHSLHDESGRMDAVRKVQARNQVKMLLDQERSLRLLKRLNDQLDKMMGEE